MILIERYINEVGRYLPRENRADIQAEIRANLIDMLEARTQGEPGEEDIVSLLQEFGPPRKVAASYSEHGQYLIGPALYPQFRMVTGIVLAAVIGAQLLAIAVGAWWLGGEAFNPLESLTGVLTSIPATIGGLVIVFAILQRFDVRPELDEAPWDPHSLPEIEHLEPVKRGERIFGIVAGSMLLIIVTLFPGWIGFISHPGGQFYANPVIPQYLGWITLSLLAGITLNIYLLWQGRWTTTGRILDIAADLLSIVVLALLLQGHNAWLAERGQSSFLVTIEQFAGDIENNVLLIGMQAFRIAFGVALVVIVVDTTVDIYRLLRNALGGKAAPVTLNIK